MSGSEAQETWTQETWKCSDPKTSDVVHRAPAGALPGSSSVSRRCWLATVLGSRRTDRRTHRRPRLRSQGPPFRRPASGPTARRVDVLRFLTEADGTEPQNPKLRAAVRIATGRSIFWCDLMAAFADLSWLRPVWQQSSSLPRTSCPSSRPSWLRGA